MNPIILYENLIKNAAITSTSFEKGLEGKNVVDGRTYSRWKAISGGSGTKSHLEFKTSSLPNSYYLGFAGHNLGVSTSTIKFRIYTGGGYFTPIKTFTASNNNPLLVQINNGSSSRFRIEFTNTDISTEVGGIFIGNLLQFPCPPNVPLTTANEGIVSQTFVSKSGKLLGFDHRYNPINISHSFSDINMSWIENEYSTFWDNHGKLMKPFFYAPDLENLPDEVYYCRFSDEHQHSFQLSNLNYVDVLQLNLVGAK